MINNVTLIGRLTKEPELRYTSSGTAVATFTLAVNRTYTNESGQREADFINCVLWRKAAETFCNYTNKGSLVGINGRIQTRNYENQQGQRVYVTEVVVEQYQFLGTNQTNQQTETPAIEKPVYENGINTNYRQENTFAGNNVFGTNGFSGKTTVYEDDLPF